ncbi:MAG: pyruvate ferredoxin oxidoreductase, partial [Nitrospirae bacterium]|nr:pyruvate ferredoxin oxidoreductase [Nitrospirota bacterium]
RFKHMFAPGNEWMLKQAQEQVDAVWERLQKESAAGAEENAE